MKSAGELPRVGISSCLLGEEVRYDGRHKRAPWLFAVDALLVEWVAVCPEVEVGMGVPREPVQLVTPGADIIGSTRTRVIGVVSGADWTARMDAWARRRLRELGALDLSGYVLKARSPSCGPAAVPVHASEGQSGEYVKEGRGIFADALMAAMPGLPIADDESLRDPDARRAFFVRVSDYRSGAAATGQPHRP